MLLISFVKMVDSLKFPDDVKKLFLSLYKINYLRTKLLLCKIILMQCLMNHIRRLIAFTSFLYTYKFFCIN